jgi:TolB protein
VPRLILALVGLVAFAAAVPSAAQVGSGRIAFERAGVGIYTVAPDGSGLFLLRPGPFGQPRWSPDGSRIAYTEFSGQGQVELHVMDADGTDDHTVATGDIRLSRRPWSPDGSRLAWGPVSAGEIYTVSASGADIRRITTDGAQKDAPTWSPTESQIAYAAALPGPPAQHGELFVARDDGSPPIQITRGNEELMQNGQPSWSPTGDAIAFLRTNGSRESAIYVVHPDGTELHRVVVVSARSSGEPAWSPDGSKITYTDAVNSGYERYGRGGQEIFIVNADGSGERRLTELAPRLAFDMTPTWSPDGDRIVFRRGRSSGPLSEPLLTMSPDGTCEGRIVEEDASDSPSWQAVPGGHALGEKSCRAVAVVGTMDPFGDESAAFVVGTITNDGTEPLTNVLLTISAPGHDLGFQLDNREPCLRRNSGFVCHIDRIGRGESRSVGVHGTARRVGRDKRGMDVALRVRFEVTADGPLLTTGRETDEVRLTARRCSARDPGRGRIDGTRFPDRVCGRRGADDIHPQGGKDFVYAGGGPDVINAWDEYGDVISCGPGRDLVIADRKDRVSRDCERVRRG